MQRVREQNHEVSQFVNNPDLMRQTIEMIRNPTIIQEITRNHDRSLINLESLSSGYNVRQRIYRDFQEPMLNVAHEQFGDNPLNTNSSSSSTANTSQVGTENTNLLPNPGASQNTTFQRKDVNNTRDNSSNKQPKLIHDEITNKSHEHLDVIENQIGMLPMYSNHEYTVENNATRCIMTTNVPELDSPELHKRIRHDKRVIYDNLTKAFSTYDNLKSEISNAVVIRVGRYLDEQVSTLLQKRHELRKNNANFRIFPDRSPNERLTSHHISCNNISHHSSPKHIKNVRDFRIDKIQPDVQFDENSFEYFNKLINKCFSKCTPCKTYKMTNRDPQWITALIKDIEFRRQKAFKQNDTTNYSRLSVKLNNKIAEARMAWANNKLGSRTDSCFWKGINAIRGVNRECEFGKRGD
ncbi:hypothetical protein GJ496_002786 [Pomphorhynchus laevis]|nr:hypothetical protein GJ496_002786 [Pomphorhynchus laevis]